ncbi:4328_t:CDS:10 [Diversispora eburnea]|uniref:Replication factor C subunit 3 n=1 Tax=Diversispora eburnea TaxID=1213867 RepID=A0A9N9ADU8_9GLOM|nr:4328_t:CDS:10 [Diversispora eburnea]
MLEDIEMDIEEEGERSPSPIKFSSSAKGKSKLKYEGVPPTGKDNLPWLVVNNNFTEYNKNNVTFGRKISSSDTWRNCFTRGFERFIEKDRVPHLLFYGPPGTGKTTSILAFARKLYGPGWKNMVLELNASDDRGINVVREEIKTYATDSMTNAAQNALRRIVEKYTRNVRFCIICNYISKIIPAVQSRCTRFRFSPIKEKEARSRIEYIIQCENVNISPDGISALQRIANGDMRKALNVLQACHAAYDYIDETVVYKCTGNPEPGDIKYIVNTMLNDEFTTAYSNVQKLKREKGLALQDIVTEVHKYLNDFEIPRKAIVFLIDQLSQIQYNLSTGGTEHAQSASMVGTFKTALDMEIVIKLFNRNSDYKSISTIMNGLQFLPKAPHRPGWAYEPELACWAHLK